MEDALDADDFARVHALLSLVDPSRRIYRSTPEDYEIKLSDKDLEMANPRKLINWAASKGSYNVVQGLLERYYSAPDNGLDNNASKSITASTAVSTSSNPLRIVPPGRRPICRTRPLFESNALYYALTSDNAGNEERSLPILQLLHAYEPNFFLKSFEPPARSIHASRTNILNLAIERQRLSTVKWLLTEAGSVPTPLALSLALDTGTTALPLLKLLHASTPDLITTPIPTIPGAHAHLNPEFTSSHHPTNTTDILALAVVDKRADVARWLLDLGHPIATSSYASIPTTSWLTSGLTPSHSCRGDGIGLFDRTIVSLLLEHGADFGEDQDMVEELCGADETAWEQFRVDRRAAAQGNEVRVERERTGRLVDGAVRAAERSTRGRRRSRRAVRSSSSEEWAEFDGHGNPLLDNGVDGPMS